MSQVFPLCRGELFSVGLFFFQCQPFSFRKESRDGAFAGMSEWRIAQIVRQTCCGNNGADFGQIRVLQFGAAGKDGFGYVIAQRTAYAGNFQAMCQPVVYEYAAGQREHLCLVLQSPERCGEDEAVVIPLKFRTVLVTLFMKLFQAESFGGYEGIPVHHVLTFLLFNCKCMTICFKIRNFAR